MRKEIQLVEPEDIPQPLMPYSPCIRAGNWVFTAGQLATDFNQETGLAPAAMGNPNNSFLTDALELQAQYVWSTMERTLTAAGCDVGKDTMRIWQWFTSDEPTMAQFHRGDNFPNISVSPYLSTQNKYFEDGVYPSQVGMGVRRLLVGGAILEIDTLAFHPDDGQQTVQVGTPANLPAGVLGRPAGVRRGDWIFLSAHSAAGRQEDGTATVGADATTSQSTWLVDPVEAQAEVVLDRLEAVAEAAGSSLEYAVKADVYIGHPRFYASIERVWKRRFPRKQPAKTVFPYMGMGAGGSLVEISLILLAKDSALTREVVETSQAPEPLGHEPQAVQAGSYLFLSQQMAFDSSGSLAAGMGRTRGFPFYGQPAKNQVHYLMGSVAAICEAAGTSVDNLCKRQVFHDDAEWFTEAMVEWASNFTGPPPCSTTIEIGGPMIVPGAHALFDLIGYIPN